MQLFFLDWTICLMFGKGQPVDIWVSTVFYDNQAWHFLTLDGVRSSTPLEGSSRWVSS
jgi:hypothetical protein